MLHKMQTIISELRNKTNKMHVFNVLYSENVLYMFRTDKLFILKRHILLYMQLLACIVHQL